MQGVVPEDDASDSCAFAIGVYVGVAVSVMGCFAIFAGVLYVINAFVGCFCSVMFSLLF